MASTISKLTMRLLIDTKSEKVIYAVASKPVVDFLFYILCLPIGSVVKLLGNNGMAGSIENLYQSVQDLNESCMQSEQSKNLVLNPIASISSYEFCNLLPTKDEDLVSSFSSSGLSDFVLVDKLNTEDDKEEKNSDNEQEDSEDDEEEDGEKGDDYYYYYDEEQAKDNEDGNDGVYFDEEEGYDYNYGESSDVYYYEKYPNDNEDGDDGVYFDEEEGYGYEDGENGDDYDYEEHANYNYNEDGDDGVYFDDEESHGSEDGENTSNNNGFVKEKVTFLVMDDLVIQPFTCSSMIEIVKKFNTKETREMIVEFGMNEGIKLLKASLESKMVLTSVFVNKEY
ncbi:hypothetical protein RYX36_036080 [Vicia faba]